MQSIKLLQSASNIFQHQILKERLSPGAQLLTIQDQTVWLQAQKRYNQLYKNMFPSFIIKPKTEQDIVQIINYCKIMNIKFAVKNGGYSPALFSTIHNGAVIDLSFMDAVVTHNVNVQQPTITYQGGCTFGTVNTYLKANLKGYTWVSGRVMGIGAIGSHGLIGDGPTSKMIGFGTDQIVQAKVVLANGKIITTNKNQNQDLLYGIKGAAPNFGVIIQVTQKIYKLLDPDEGQQIYMKQANFAIKQPSQIQQIFVQLKQINKLSQKCYISMFLLKNSLLVSILEYLYDPLKKIVDTTKKQFHKRIQKLFQKYPKIQSQQENITKSQINVIQSQFIQPQNLKRHYDIYLSTQKVKWENNIFTHSGICNGFHQQKGNDVLAVKCIAQNWLQIQNEGLSEESLIFITLYGGQKHRSRDTSSSCFPANSDTSVLIMLNGIWKDQKYKLSTIKWVRKLGRNAQKYFDFGNVDGVSSNISNKETLRWIYGQENYQKLLKVKKIYDPENLFSNNLNINPNLE